MERRLEHIRIDASSNSDAVWRLDLLGIIPLLFNNWNLIRQLARRNLEGRYKGAVIGFFWSFVNPIVMLLIYTFVFGYIFNSKWPGAPGQGGLMEYAVLFFAGVVVFNIFSECVGMAPGMISSNPNYVKKVLFPIEAIPISHLLSCLFHGGIGFLILLPFSFFVFGPPAWTALLIPLSLAPLLFLSLGISWTLSSLGVYFKDINPMINLLLLVLFFLSPVCYGLETLPGVVRPLIMQCNPMAFILESIRGELIWGKAPDLALLAQWWIIGIAVMLGGYSFFVRTKRGFADVI